MTLPIRKRYLSLLALILAATGLALWNRFHHTDLHALLPAAITTTENRQPDYVIEGMTTWALDTQGNVTRHVTANKLTHYPGDDSTHMQQPLITTMNNGTALWSAQARTGISQAGNNLVKLNDDVVITRFQSSPQQFVKLFTTQLALQPDTQVAHTREQVRIEFQHGTLSARGMRVDMHNGRLELLNGVNGIYATH